MNPYLPLIKALLVLALLAFIGWCAYTINGWRVAAQTNAATVQTHAATEAATSGITTDLSAAQQDGQKVDIVVHQARDTYAAQYANVLKTDASASSWDASPVPPGLRAAARSRRCAHDRFTDTSAGSPCPN